MVPVDAVSANLPLQLTSFIGREREIAEIKRLLDTTRLLTLTGSGGAGKTRLAVQVASQLTEHYDYGTWFVDLAPLNDSTLVPQAIASVFDLHESTDTPLTAVLTNYLRSKNLLLVLDNCEHLIEACAQIADTLLRGCPNLSILATSREPLSIAGESTFRVPSLSLPDSPNATIELLRQFEAIRLFIERASAADHDFKMTNQNAATVAQICQRLDGMPLAIELAAVRVRSLAVDQIAARLANRFSLLTGGSRSAPTRQQTLCGAIDWSYDLLSEQERELFQRLAVFAGGWTLEAVEQVCDRSFTVVDTLRSLVDKSLVVVEQKDSDLRYRFLETVRQYAHEKLVESGAAQAVRNRHLNYFIDLAEKSEWSLLGGVDQIKSLQRWEMEHDNLRTALAWSVENNETEAGLRLAATVRWFWLARSHFSEGREWLQKFMKRNGSVSPLVRAKALEAATWIESFVGNYVDARQLGEECLALYRQVNNKIGIAWALGVLGNMARDTADYSRARALYEESLALGREIGNDLVVIWALGFLGDVIFLQGNYAEARQLYDESLAIGKKIGDRWSRVAFLESLAEIAQFFQHDYERAAALYNESLTLGRKLGETLNVSASLIGLGDIALSQDDYKQAAAFYTQSLRMNWERANKRGLAECLGGFARLALATGQGERLARLDGAAKAMRELIGAGTYHFRGAENAKTTAKARAQLGEATFKKAWEEGRKMTLEQAIEFTLSDPVSESAIPIAPHDPNALTTREVEVLRLVAHGLSDAEVAEKLVISVRTVNTHLSSIYGKLGVKSRSAATRYALDHKLV
ncbi:MAG: tetratricopeptide repeat protein [Chloroflexi bacterium]|nr:tetratricopeptide repeat protein [Chloroflexota bacterium]